MTFFVAICIVIVVIILVITGKSNQTDASEGNQTGNQTDVSEDPCINQIVQFVQAVQGIKADNNISSWIDFYAAEKTIVCRFYDFEGSSELYYVNFYTNSSNPDKERMVESFKQMFNEKINFSNFPQGTRLEIRDPNEGTYQLLYSVTPMYQHAIRSYRNAVANAIRQAGITFDDTDSAGSLNPDRIYIINIKVGRA